MLDEVELLVARLDGEVFSLWRLVCSLRAERRIREHDVVAFSSVWLVDGVAEVDMWFDAVQVHVHQRESPWSWDEFLAVVRARPDALGVCAVECSFGFVDKPLVPAHEESSGAARGVHDPVFLVRTRVRLHEVLSCALLALARSLLQEPLECCSFDVDVHRAPVFVVDHLDQLLEVDGIIEARGRLRKYFA